METGDLLLIVEPLSSYSFCKQCSSKELSAALKEEPRGFEPLTSAVQRRTRTVVVVRSCLEIPANKHISSRRLSYVFAITRLGWCQIGVNWCRYICTSADSIIAHVFLQFEQNIRSRRADSSWDEAGRCRNRSRTTRTRVCSPQLPSGPRSSRRWADPTHHLGQSAGLALKASRSRGPDRTRSRAPLRPRLSP